MSHEPAPRWIVMVTGEIQRKPKAPFLAPRQTVHPRQLLAFEALSAGEWVVQMSFKNRTVYQKQAREEHRTSTDEQGKSEAGRLETGNGSCHFLEKVIYGYYGYM